jgi:peptidoglycan/LPS O-acetylase OafA/YrhL
MLGLLLIAFWGLRNRRHDLAGLALFTLLALLGNSFICGALSNPHDRYQGRLVWIAPLVCGMALMAYRQQYKKNRHVSRSSGLEKTQGSF